MSGAVIVSPQIRLRAQSRHAQHDERLRAASRSKRAEILDQIGRHPDADEGLRRQARLYRERLEAGMEQPDDA